ncbi:MAG: ABC transporter substrate-binding protein, partial [Acidimicrobiia bacterium]
MTARSGRRRGTAAGTALLAGVLLAACAGTQPRNVQDGTTLDGSQAGATTTTGGGPGAFGGNIPDLPGNFPAVRNVPRGPATATTTRRTTPATSQAAGTAARGPTTGSPTPTSPIPTVPNPGAVPPGGNGGATDVGVTADTIRLGGFYAESGPAGPLGITLLKAAKAVYNEVNAQGGIYGRKIQVVDCDTSYTSGDRPRSCFEKLAREDKVFAFASAGDGPAMVTATPLICKEQIPAIAMDGLAAEEFKCPSVFPAGPPARSQAHVLADYHARKYQPRT